MDRRRLTVFALVALLALGAWLFLRPRSPLVAARDASAGGSSLAERGRVGTRALGGSQPLHPLGGHAEAIASSDVGAFEGEVRSVLTGRPVAGAEISLVGPTGALTGRSTPEGRFELSPPTEGIYEVTLVRADGYAPFSTDLGEAPIELRAARGTMVRGITLWLSPVIEYVAHVVDADDNPVARATVIRSHQDRAVAERMVGPLTTDDRGEVRFVAQDGTIVEASHPKAGSGRAHIDESAAISHAITVVLRVEPTSKPPVRITGRVTDPSGVLVPDVRVTAATELNPSTEAARENLGGTAFTDAHGEFSLDVAPGPYRLIAEDGHLGPARASVDAASSPPPITLVLTNAALVRGGVTDDGGRPVASFSVIVARADGIRREIVAARTVLDGSGRYEIAALPAGPHLVTVQSEKQAPSAERAVTLVAGEAAEADFVLHAGARLTGVVRDAKTRRPIADANVALEGYRGAGTTSTPVAAAAYSDAAGRFELDGLGRGAHSVMVSAAGHHARVVGGLVVQEADTVGPIDVALTPLEKGEEPRIELVGIGAALSPKDDALVIGRVLPGGGAAEVGLGEGDRVVRVDGQPVSELGFAGAVQAVRGPEGTSVTLVVVKSGGGEVTLTVPRRSIKN
jgi:hypothetical protein